MYTQPYLTSVLVVGSLTGVAVQGDQHYSHASWDGGEQRTRLL